MADTSEDCPCCGPDPRSRSDYDAALLTAFLGGVASVQAGMPVPEALCEKHGRMAAEAIAFVIANGGAEEPPA